MSASYSGLSSAIQSNRKEFERRLKRLQYRLTRKRKMFLEQLETRFLLASDWQNPLWRLDVDDDTTTLPLDALVLINRINSAVPVDFSKPVGTDNYLDVDGDRTLSPLDVLSVINFLNAPPERITVELALRNDSGRFRDDKITNDSSFVGSFVRSSSGGYSAQARFNRGPVRDLVVDSADRFLLVGNEPISDGSVDIKVLISGPNGSVGLRRLSFVLDTSGPSALGLGILAADDTGISNSDGITKLARPRIHVQSSAGDPVLLKMNNQVLFDGVASGEIIVPSPLLADGTYDLSVESFDIAGNGGVTNRTIQLDTEIQGQALRIHSLAVFWQYCEAEIGLPIACPMGSGQVLNSVEGVFPSLSRTFPQSDYADGFGDQHRI